MEREGAARTGKRKCHYFCQTAPAMMVTMKLLFFMLLNKGVLERVERTRCNSEVCRRVKGTSPVTAPVRSAAHLLRQSRTERKKIRSTVPVLRHIAKRPRAFLDLLTTPHEGHREKSENILSKCLVIHPFWNRPFRATWMARTRVRRDKTSPTVSSE